MKRSVLLGVMLLAASLSPRAASGWDVRCVPDGEPDDVECPDPFANVRTTWRDHPLAEHRRLLVESLQIAGVPDSLQDEFELTVYAGSETFEAAGGVYDSVHPVLTGAAFEQSRTLTVQMMASLPDFSYTLWDWASGNEVCPPSPGDPALDCHNYESHIGWLNSNHMLPQARHWYGYLHGLALERASACSDLADALEEPHETRFLDWLLACEKEAMVLEAVAQHYLQDAWAIGHMMERWGSTEPADFLFDRGLGFLVSGFVGAVHGSKAMLDEDPIFGPQGPWDDPLNAPHADVGYVDGLDGPLPRPGVGDRFLPQLLGFLPGLDDYELQREALFGCAVDGLREVYAATAQLHGALEAPLAGLLDGRRQVENDSCWAQRATNRSFDTGIGVHRGAFDVPATRVIPGVVGWTLSDVVGFFLLDAPVTTPEVRERFQTDAGYVATRAALRAQDAPDGTVMASGAGGLSLAGIGSNSVYARGGPGVQPAGYSDPLLPWGLSDSDPRVEERKQALNLTFADAHAADRCGDLSEADLEAYVDAAHEAAGGDPEAAQAACGQCVQLVAPHLRFGVVGNHDPNREAFCALVAEPPVQPAFLYTDEDPVFDGTEPRDLGNLLAAAREVCCTVVAPPVEVEIRTGVTLAVDHSTDFEGEAHEIGEEEGGVVPFNRTLTATSPGGQATARASVQAGSASASGSGSVALSHTLNDDDHSASGRAQSGLGVEICVAERSSFSLGAQVMLSSDASEESTDAEIVLCCDQNGGEVARFASDAPGAPRSAVASLNGTIGSRGRGAATECVSASVEVDALLQAGQTRSTASWSLTVRVSASP